MRRTLWVILFVFTTQIVQAPRLSFNDLSKANQILAHQLKEKEIQQKDEHFQQAEFSPQVFYEALIFVGVQNPDIVFKQSVLETGWFKSQLFTQYNNPFGMKQPVHRETLCIGTELGHGYFPHWYDAVKDYKLWQEYWIEHELDPEDYYSFLDELPYAEAQNYTRTLRTIDINDYLNI